MKITPKITIVTVCYNSKKGLEDTILSVISQTYNNYEYIIVDGGSKDGTLSIIHKYETHISKWVSEPDNGLYDAMNKGIRMASGEWINFMNAGDIFSSNNIISEIFSQTIPKEKEFLYSDVLRRTSNSNLKLYNNDRSKCAVNHQASIYKISLHKSYGLYLTKKPYSIYDLMFFLSIPEEYFFKVQDPIAIVEPGGISDQGAWIIEKSQALFVVFGYKSLTNAFFTFWRRRIKRFLFKLFRI